MILGLAIAVWASVGEAAVPDVDAALSRFVDDAATRAALIDKAREATATCAAELQGQRWVDPGALETTVLRNIEANLSEKPRGFIVDAEDLGRTVMEYEAFKACTYLEAGVYPKRWWGYLDLNYDTAQIEGQVVRVTRTVVPLLNEWLEQSGSDVRVTEAEIAVTFLAEGGTLLIDGERTDRNAVHPVTDMGLANIAVAISEEPDLVTRLDQAAETALAETTSLDETADSTLAGEARELPGVRGTAILKRELSFDEAIVATGLLWARQKARTDQLLRNRRRTPLADRELSEQFIHTSLVFNSGLLHDEARIPEIQQLRTAETLAKTSWRNRRRRAQLDLAMPRYLWTELTSGEGYREQPSSWLAAYHVTQRYGAMQAIERFTDIFRDDGSFTPRMLPARPMVEIVTPPPQTESEESTRRAALSCSSASSMGLAATIAGWLCIGIGLGRRRRR